MSARRTHWYLTAAFSWPSGPGRMRTFHLGDGIPCPAQNAMVADAADDIASVTCKRCLAIHARGRFDTAATVRKVLSRGGCTAPLDLPPTTEEPPR